MDVETVDREYQQLEREAQQLATAIQQLAEKMQGASGRGDTQAKEWLLDLKSIALQIQQEQLQVQALLQALHGFAVNNLPAPQQNSVSSQPQQYVTSPQANWAPAQGGGVLSRFRMGGFGQAMTQGLGMGAGFGIADSVINAIFNR